MFLVGLQNGRFTCTYINVGMMFQWMELLEGSAFVKTMHCYTSTNIYFLALIIQWCYLTLSKFRDVKMYGIVINICKVKSVENKSSFLGRYIHYKYHRFSEVLYFTNCMRNNLRHRFTSQQMHVNFHYIDQWNRKSNLSTYYAENFYYCH